MMIAGIEASITLSMMVTSRPDGMSMSVMVIGVYGVSFLVLFFWGDLKWASQRHKNFLYQPLVMRTLWLFGDEKNHSTDIQLARS
jgi:hypothetical protein